MKKEMRSTQRGIRIVGGYLKQSKIKIINQNGLRPTTDRARETIFNWLLSFVQDSNVVDCFAGSGVLGFEALSRGANKCIFIEKNLKVAQNIKSNINRFQLQSRTCLLTKSVFDCDSIIFETASIIFADPPFNQCATQAFLSWIQNKVEPDCRVVVEFASNKTLNSDGFEILREFKAGNSAIHLLKPMSL